jgi:predicted DNA-binding transcriptional regulator AlpA
VASEKKKNVCDLYGLGEERRLLTEIDVARITGLSPNTLAQWRSQRRGIPFIKLSRNVVRYRQHDLEEWLNNRMVRV